MWRKLLIAFLLQGIRVLSALETCIGLVRRNMGLPLSKQMALNIAVHTMQKQKWERSANISEDDYMCRFRSDKNMRCAGGSLMADSWYREEMEGHAWPLLYYRYPAFKATMEKLGEDFWRDLVRAHDDGLTPSEMKENFLELTNKYHLLAPYCLLAAFPFSRSN